MLSLIDEWCLTEFSPPVSSRAKCPLSSFFLSFEPNSSEMPQECLLSRWRAIIILVPIKDLARCHAQVSVLYIARVGMKVLDMARLIDVRERCRFRIGLVRRETSITVSSSSSSSSWSSSNGGLRKQLATLSIRRLFMRNFLLDNHFRANDKNKPFLQTKTATFGSTFERKPFLSKRKLHFNKLSK